MKKYNKLKYIPNIIFSIIMIILLSAEIGAQQIPSLEVIAKKVLKATTPKKGYVVTITQSIKATNKTNIPQSIANGIIKRQIKFYAKYDPQFGLKAQKLIDNNNNTTNNLKIKNQKSLIKQGNIKVIVDLIKFFKNIDKLQGIKIVSVNFNNRNYFKVTAQNKPFSYSFWIDAANYYVSKAILSINNKKFAETNINYKYINNKYWLPVRLIIENASDGTQITQNFADYIF